MIDMKNSLVLAYLGDSVFELYIREYIISIRDYKVNDLQKVVTGIVSAKGQSKILNSLMDNNILTEEELSVVMNGRNHKTNSHPKNTDIITYKYATGFEALIGYLYLNNKTRLDEIMNLIIKEYICI